LVQQLGDRRHIAGRTGLEVEAVKHQAADDDSASPEDLRVLERSSKCLDRLTESSLMGQDLGLPVQGFRERPWPGLCLFDGCIGQTHSSVNVACVRERVY
jgi:hypothetical protein